MQKNIGFWNIANILSLSRIPLGIICAAFILFEFYIAALAVGIVAGITDYFDGYFAKKRKLTTKAGAIIDPATDKVFMILVIAAMTIKLDVALWKPFLILSREIVEAAAFLFFLIINYKPKIELKARMLGKIVTTLQFIALFAVFLSFVYQNIIIYALVIVTIAALADYSIQIIKAR